MLGPGIRAALAEHVSAYGEVTSAAARQWSTQLLRRTVGYVAAAAFALVAMLVIVFVAILAAWPTPWRWWVVGGILLLFGAGIAWGLVTAAQAARGNAPPPWAVLAEELATDLRGAPDRGGAEPEPAPPPEREFDPYRDPYRVDPSDGR